MRTLSVHVRNWCAPWAYASVPYVHAQHAHQFSYFSNVHFVTLSMRVRNWCVHWACASGTDACTEYARQELMRKLSIRVRNWCMYWAYASGTNVCTERIPLSIRTRNWCIPWAYGSGTDAYAQHAHQFLLRMLSMRISSWRVCSACALVSYLYAQQKHKNSKFEKGPYKPSWAYA